MPTENQSAAPVIIEAAINGATRKETNPNVPKSVEEVADDALAAIDAGAAIVHAHCDPFGGHEALLSIQWTVTVVVSCPDRSTAPGRAPVASPSTTVSIPLT